MTIQAEPQGVFYAAELPLGWQALNSPQPTQIAQWQHEAVTLLRALPVIETPLAETERDIAAPAGKAVERLEAKLDLALNLISQLVRQNSQLPLAQPIVLRANTLEWRSETAPRQDQQILLALHLSPLLPQALIIPALVTSVSPQEKGFLIKASFLHLNPDLEDSLERTLFRFHRRAIQQSHSRQQGNP